MPRPLPRLMVWVCFVTCVFFAGSTAAQQPAPLQGTGALEGRVIDGTTGDPLPGARVTVMGSAIETSTDRDGRFVIGGLEPGDVTVIVSYLGRRDESASATVSAGI